MRPGMEETAAFVKGPPTEGQGEKNQVNLK